MNRIPDDVTVLLRELTEAVNEVLTTKGSAAIGEWRDDQILGEAPLAFDSLDLQQLSIVLEERLGTDPYTAGVLPRTLGELRRFYQASGRPAGG